jgi:hypothetical protein
MRIRISNGPAVTDGEDGRIEGWKPNRLHPRKKRNKRNRPANSLSWNILQVSRLLARFYRREWVSKFDKYRRINIMDALI